MLAFAHSAAIAGIDAYVVRVESDSAAGTPAFHIVGLPDRALNESRDRVRSAIVNSGFGFPPGQLLVNLAPADPRKSGVGFDLAVALTLLATDEQIDRAVTGRRHSISSRWAADILTTRPRDVSFQFLARILVRRPRRRATTCGAISSRLSQAVKTSIRSA